MTEPIVRILDASLHDLGGPVHLVVERLDRVGGVAEAVAQAGGQATVSDASLVVLARATQIVDAAGRTGGAEVAEPLRAVLERALVSWAGEVPAIDTPAGRLPTDERPVVMGIVNVTPDSFSDGGHHDSPARALAHAEQLATAGADVLDVGGESSRPGARPVDEATELDRVLPVVEELARRGHVVSVDTTKAVVAREAVHAGAAMVNDVAAGDADDALLRTVGELEVPYVLMHHAGDPRTMQDDPRYDDVVATVFSFLANRLDACVEAGIDPAGIVVDPGIGFGKTTAHNLALLASVRQLTSLGRPVLVGASRKRFVGEVARVPDPTDRDVPSAAIAAMAVGDGASVLRVHDVAATVHAVRAAAAVRDAGRPSAD